MIASIDVLVKKMFEKQASDLHITANAVPLMRIDGDVVPADEEPLRPERCLALAYRMLTDEQKEKFERDHELNLSFGISKVGRVRMSMFKQRGSVAATLRSIPNGIESFEALGLPPIVADIVQLPKGLLLVTGPTGSGKSTTITSMLDWINRNKAMHIMTLEEPIEYIHDNHKAIVNQREVGTDTQGNAQTLRQVMRCDPDVVMISDLHNIDTIQAALTLAETGHLVIAAMNTTDSVQAIYRVIDTFPPHQQFRARMQLSIALQTILVQQLLPKGYSSGRVLASEILIPTSAVRSLIRESKEYQIYQLMQTGSEYGMQTMNQSLFDLYQKQLVTYNEIFARTTDPRDLQLLVKGTL